MVKDDPSVKSLVGLQKALRYIFLFWFLAATAVYLADGSAAIRLASWGIVLLLVGTVARLLATAELFRRSALYRYWLLSWLLLVVLLSTIALKYWHP